MTAIVCLVILFIVLPIGAGACIGTMLIDGDTKKTNDFLMRLFCFSITIFIISIIGDLIL